MAIVINGNGIDMGNNPVSNASQIDGVVINENGAGVATLVEANSYDIGVGQTWQNVTASRVSGTTYTNSTGKPIQILVTSYSTASGNTGIVIFNIDGIVFYTNHTSGTSTANLESVATSLIIPNGATYSVTSSSGSTISVWLELR